MLIEQDLHDAAQVGEKATLSNSTAGSLPLLNLNAGRAAVLAYFENTWALTEQLFSSLASDEAYYARP